MILLFYTNTQLHIYTALVKSYAENRENFRIIDIIMHISTIVVIYQILNRFLTMLISIMA